MTEKRLRTLAFVFILFAWACILGTLQGCVGGVLSVGSSAADARRATNEQECIASKVATNEPMGECDWRIAWAERKEGHEE